MRNRLRNFMIGRYGPDQLYMALFIAALVIDVVAMISGLAVLTVVSFILLAWAIFRVFSRNIAKRRRENDRFLTLWRPVKNRVRGFFRRVKDSRHYRFFRCPGCKNRLRVPKGKGKIQIACPRCGERFIKKT